MRPRSRYGRRCKPLSLMSVRVLLEDRLKTVANSDAEAKQQPPTNSSCRVFEALYVWQPLPTPTPRLAGTTTARKVKELEGSSSLGHLPSRSISSTSSLSQTERRWHGAPEGAIFNFSCFQTKKKLSNGGKKNSNGLGSGKSQSRQCLGVSLFVVLSQHLEVGRQKKSAVVDERQPRRNIPVSLCSWLLL